MANPALIQKQIKDNTEDLHNFVRDLNLWEQEMKRKDRQLSTETFDEVLPPVRRPKLSEKTKKEKKDQCKVKKIRSYDYKSWDKFDVEKACEEIDNDNETNENEENSDSAEQEENYLKEKGLYEKELGNQHVKASRWDNAIESYTRAISAYSKDPVFFANRALCYLKKKLYDQVETDCTEALKLDPTYVKALMRRAAAREELGRLEDARNDLTLALQLEPHNTQAQRDLARVKLAAIDSKTKTVKHSDKIVTSPSGSGSEKELNKSSLQLSSQPVVDNTDQFNKNSCLTKKKQVDNKDYNSEPNWLPCGNTIEPIIKPPHLRSKKNLKKIEIHDVGLNNPKHVCSRKQTKHESPAETMILQPSAMTKTEPLEKSNPKSIFSVKGAGSVEKDVPPVPKSAMQFHEYWSSIESDKALCFRFIKQIPGASLPDIFKESLESKIFSSIVEVLASEFVAAKEPVMQYLKGLSGVRRFAAIVLFMSSTDKTNLTTLFKFCENNEECSPLEIEELRKLYEVF